MSWGLSCKVLDVRAQSKPQRPGYYTFLAYLSPYLAPIRTLSRSRSK